MTRRFRTWLRRRLKLRGKTQRREFGVSKPMKPAPSTQADSPPLPPPYATADPAPRIQGIHELPSNIDGSESLEVLRTRHPATRPPSDAHPVLRAPQYETHPIAATELAAQAAVIGMIRALDEPDPAMVAARTARAIAVAVSTTRSYAAFVAAVTAAESSALLLIEDNRDNSQHERCRRRQINAFKAAADAAMIADAGITPVGAWPFNIYDINPLESLSQKSSSFT